MNSNYTLWRNKALRDLTLVRKELKTPDPLLDIVAFHLQQFVEKYLKSFLVYHTVDFKKTHDIAELLNQCIDIDQGFTTFKHEDFINISIFSVSMRYPETTIEIDRKKTEEILNLSLQLKEFIDKKLHREK